MIISFFSTGTGGGAAPGDYLTTREVLVYDENRNLIRDDTGEPQTKIRDPLPEVRLIRFVGWSKFASAPILV